MFTFFQDAVAKGIDELPRAFEALPPNRHERYPSE
jgi:hypothetical protein